jgi:hypothetical protein
MVYIIPPWALPRIKELEGEEDAAIMIMPRPGDHPPAAEGGET